jgi:hypothetical protein
VPAFTWNDLLNEAGDAAQSYEPLAKGDYDVKVVEAKVGSTGNDNKKYALTLEVETGPHAKRKLWKDLIVAQTSGGLAAFFRQMAALGLDAKFFATNPKDELIIQRLVGARAVADVGQREWNNQIKNEVNWLKVQTKPAPSGGAPVVGGGVPAPSAPPVAAPPAPPVAAPAGPAGAVQDAPPVAQPPAPAAPQAAPAPAPADDAWGATPPVMNGLGNDPF